MADLRIRDEGSIFLLSSHSAEGDEWIAQSIPEDAMRMGLHQIVVEHRFVQAIIQGAVDDGLDVSLITRNGVECKVLMES
jgi:hypothetical protein